MPACFGNALDTRQVVVYHEGPGAAPPPARQPLTAGDLRAELAGNTLYWDSVNILPVVFGGRLNLFMAADGVLYGTLTSGPDGGTEHDVGTWRTTAEGQLCGSRTCGITGGNAATPYTGRARPSNSIGKTD